MPHVVFDKRIDFEKFSEKFEPTMIREPFLIKLTDVYVNKEKQTSLIPAIVIDSLHQEFLIEVSTRKDKTTVRLFPGTDPQKTDGVKTSLGLVAKMIQDNNPDYNIAKTNIKEFLSPISK